MKLAEILTGPETWCQGMFRSADGRHCLVGALQALHGIRPGNKWPEWFSAEMDRMRRLTQLQGWADVAWWNDHRFRTWDEVATVVDAYDRDRMLNP